jgi:hypothetical protein
MNDDVESCLPSVDDKTKQLSEVATDNEDLQASCRLGKLLDDVCFDASF